MAPNTRNQTGLNPYLQDRCWDIAKRIFPDHIKKIAVPLVIALPAGIHPYNKAGGYIDGGANAMVIYQHLGREALREAKNGNLPLSVEHFLIHEFSHWYQRNVLKASFPPSVNAHVHISWSQSCFEITNRLFPNQYDLNFFKPLISKRFGKKVQKVQREGAMDLQQLHHFPRMMLPQFENSILQ